MFETLTVTTLLLMAFFFWQNQRLGLTSAIPKDPNNRVQFFCSECLTSLKTLLPRSTILELKSDSIRFTPSGSSQPHQLSVREGKVWLTQGDAPARSVSFLGPQGRLEFEKISDTGLMVKVDARVEEAAHDAALRLEVEYA